MSAQQVREFAAFLAAEFDELQREHFMEAAELWLSDSEGEWKSFDHLDDSERDPYPHLSIGDMIRPADDVPGRLEYMVTEIHAELTAGRPRTLTCLARDTSGRAISVSNVANWFRRTGPK